MTREKNLKINMEKINQQYEKEQKKYFKIILPSL